MNGIADFVLNNSGQQKEKNCSASAFATVLKQKEMGLNAQRAAIKAHYFLTLLVTTTGIAVREPQVLTYRM